MLKKVLLIISYFVTQVFVSGCVSKSVQSGPMGPAILFKTKAQVVDKKAESSHNVAIDIFLLPNQALRLEVTALLGYDVASLLMVPNQLKYVLYPNKLFVQGPLAGRTLKPLFKQEVDPKLLWYLAHNQSLGNKGFRCVRSGVTESCENSQLKVQVLIERHGLAAGDDIKKITIDSSALKLTWVFKSKEAYASQNETFVLAQPEDYKLLDIK